MFEALAEKITGVLTQLKRKGALSEGDIKAAMREVRLALLEADVNVTVAKALLNAVREKALGAEVLQSLSPGQQVVGIVSQQGLYVHAQALLGTGPRGVRGRSHRL